MTVTNFLFNDCNRQLSNQGMQKLLFKHFFKWKDESNWNWGRTDNAASPRNRFF